MFVHHPFWSCLILWILAHTDHLDWLLQGWNQAHCQSQIPVWQLLRTQLHLIQVMGIWEEPIRIQIICNTLFSLCLAYSNPGMTMMYPQQYGAYYNPYPQYGTYYNYGYGTYPTQQAATTSNSSTVTPSTTTSKSTATNSIYATNSATTSSTSVGGA